MRCPKCQHIQPGTIECERCGVIFAKLKKQSRTRRPQSKVHQPGAQLYKVIGERDALFIQQKTREWLEILLDWEQANEYMIRATDNTTLGYITEISSGFLGAMKRIFLGSHRPLHVEVHSHQTRELVLSLDREFFFFFSDMDVSTPDGTALGSVHRRFGIIYKKYDLKDEKGRVFARIQSPFWRLWTFPVIDDRDREMAVITKKWGGLAREYFTDADNFLIDFGKHTWTFNQKSVLFAAALSIDFDFFENNKGSR